MPSTDENSAAVPAPAEIDALLASYKAGDLTAAERIAKEVAAKFPDHPFGWKALGVIATRTGRHEDALLPMRQALRLAPSDAEAHSNLGSTLNDLAQFEEAESSCREAIRLKPVLAEAHSNLGTALKGRGRTSEAIESYSEALRLRPGDAQTHYNLGSALQAVGRLGEAEASGREAIRLAPDFSQAHNNLGVILADLGQLRAAQASYSEALRCDPNYADAHNNLGNVLKDLGRLTEAEFRYREAIRLAPGFAEAFSNLGTVLGTLGRAEEADICWREAIRLKPDHAEAHGNRLFTMCYRETISPQAACDAARHYGAQVSARTTPKFLAWRGLSGKTKLRIGFVSGDLCDHPVAVFLDGLLAHLDRKAFELVAFPSSPKTDEVTHRLKQQFDAWCPIYGMDDPTAAAHVHAQGIDVLFDLSGHTRDNRLAIFGYKPAPVQVAWLGYPNTTGLPEMDFRLIDAITDPEPSYDAFATEKLKRLEGGFLCYTPPREAPSPQDRPLGAAAIFGSANNFQKVGDATVSLWAQILKALPDAKLALKSHRMFGDPQARAAAVAKFATYEIARDRLIFHEGALSQAGHLAFYNEIDVALDPLVYNGTTTSCEALWMGVPVVTLAGDRHAARVGASLLTSAGMPELIAADRADYVAKAVALAADRNGLAARRASQRTRLVASALLDAPRFARKFAAFLTTVVGDRALPGTIKAEPDEVSSACEAVVGSAAVPQRE